MIRRVAIFLPRTTDFYVTLFEQIRRGFEACGIETSGGTELLNAAEIRDFCSAHRPDVVFEMNRARAQAPGVPEGTRHVAWIVDLAGRTVDDFEGSDITYFFGPAWVTGYTRSGFHRCLVPGSCPVDYPAQPESESLARRTHDLGFVGHIPRPWSAEELARNVTGGAANATFADLLPLFENELRKIWDPPPIRRHIPNGIAQRDRVTGGWRAVQPRGVPVASPIAALPASAGAAISLAVAEEAGVQDGDGVWRAEQQRARARAQWNPLMVADRLVRELCGEPLVVGDDKLRYDLLSRVIRHVSRGDLADAMLATQRTVAFYGPDQWQQWPQYAAHYRGWLNDAAAMRSAYASTEINCHEGEGMHFRSIDILGSGGVLLFRNTNRDQLPGGIASFFEPGVHYLSCSLDELPQAAMQALDDRASLVKMRREAARAVAAGHTWKHRAAEILTDLEHVA